MLLAIGVVYGLMIFPIILMACVGCMSIFSDQAGREFQAKRDEKIAALLPTYAKYFDETCAGNIRQFFEDPHEYKRCVDRAYNEYLAASFRNN